MEEGRNKNRKKDGNLPTFKAQIEWTDMILQIDDSYSRRNKKVYKTIPVTSDEFHLLKNKSVSTVFFSVFVESWFRVLKVY
jgi:hypothetical protein